MWAVNVKAVFFLIQDCLDLLRASGSANICITSSRGGKYPEWSLGVYTMGKAALDNMVKSLAAELLPDNIRVNGIAPGLVKTKLAGPLVSIVEQGVLPKEVMGTPENIAGMVATICA